MTYRARRLLLLLMFTGLTLVVVYGAFFYLYRSFHQRLDEELGSRLTAVASVTAALVDEQRWELLRSGDPRERALFRSKLSAVQDANQLSDIFLFDVNQVTVFDLSGQYGEGEANPLLDLDAAAVTTSLSGIPTASGLYEHGGSFLKTGYAPILVGERIAGAVGVEASAGFFQILRGLGRALVGAAVFVTLALGAMGVLFSAILNRQGRLEHRLRQTETLAALGQMTAMVAHEIRNPLGIIRGAAETLEERYDLAQDEVYRFIPEEVDRLSQTLTTYLDFASSGTAGGTEDVRESLVRTLDILTPDLERKHIEIHRDLESGDFPTAGSSRLLQQAFLNLVFNARDAMPHGGTLHVTLRRENRRAVVTVRDSGKGMESAVLDRALTPFFTTKDQGSGLGLAVVHRTVQENGGSLNIESSPGQGTTVRLSIKLA